MKTNKRNTENKRNNGGFSLVELIVVIAIMAVLVAVAAPQFTKYIDRSRQSVDAQTVSGIVTAAQVGIADVTEYGNIKEGNYAITLAKDKKTAAKVEADTADGGTSPGADALTEMENVIKDACGPLADLHVTANKWDSVQIKITVTADYSVAIDYSSTKDGKPNEDFKNYITNKKTPTTPSGGGSSETK